MFICAAWQRRQEGPMQERRTNVVRCDLDEGHAGRHCDKVLLVSWDDSESDPESRPHNQLKNLSCESLTDGWYVVEDRATKERSVVNVRTQQDMVGGRLRSRTIVYGIGDDNSWEMSRFLEYWSPMRKLNIDIMAVGQFV